MPAVNERLQDQAVDRAIDLQRYSNGVVHRMIAVLNRSDARLSAALAEALLKMDRASFTVERLERLLADVRKINAAAYAQVMGELRPEMEGLAGVESRYQRSALRQAVPPAVQLQYPIAGASVEQVYAAALARPFQGRLLSGWASNLEASRLRLIQNAVRQGFVEGQTAAEIVRKVTGTKALKFADGVLAIPRRELMAVVQTALSHTAQVARQAFYDANADLIKAVKWTSTLDSRTSPQCRIRDGLEYTADRAHKPIGHAVPWGDGPGRLHFNCRSTSSPITKSWRELGIDADELPASTRASMDGQVPGDLTYAQWLAKQPVARQEEVLGARRAALFRAGVPMEKFYNDKGQWLTLEQLAARGLTKD